MIGEEDVMMYDWSIGWDDRVGVILLVERGVYVGE